MHTVLQAMLWELWRTSRFELLVRLAWQVAIIFLIYTATADASAPEIAVVRGVVVLLLAISSTFSMTWLNALDSEDVNNGFSFRLGFTRPVSTARLVALPMLFSVVVAVSFYLLPAALFRFLMGVPMPLVGPAVIIASAIVCLVATAWSPATRIGRSLAITGLLVVQGIAMYFFHNSRHDPDVLLMAIGKPEYFQLAWYEYAALIVVAAAAFIVVLIAVEGQRHGDRWFEGLRLASSRWRLPPVARAASATKPFPGPVAAQCWYEMRRFGSLLLALGVAGALIVVGAISTMLWLDPNWQGAPSIALLAVVICPIVYQVVGVNGAIGLRHKQGSVTYSAFDATRSLSNDQLIAIKLLVVAACSLAAWLCMVAAVVMHAAAAGYWPTLVQSGEVASGQLGHVPSYWWIAGVSNAVLLYASSSSILLALGLWLPLHPKVLVSGFLVIFLHLILAGWDEHHGWRLQLLWVTYAYLLAVAIVAVSFFALWKALAAGYLTKRFFGFAFGLWVIYILSSVALYTKTTSALSIPLPLLALGGAMLLVPLATTAAAPLALAAHRHG